MTVDLLDQAFLQATAGQQPRNAPAAGAPDSNMPVQPDAIAAGPAVTAELEAMPGESAVEAVDLTLLQLLERFPDQWATVVTAVEEARRAGARVIAVAGHQRGEGRTTLVQGLGLLLAERGWQVTCFATAAAWWRELVGPEASGRHCLPPAAVGEDDLVLVDAGIWFPPGPLRPRQLLLKMFGFDGVLLMRHVDLPPCPVRDGVIAKAGLQAIGEIVSFSSPTQQRVA